MTLESSSGLRFPPARRPMQEAVTSAGPGLPRVSTIRARARGERWKATPGRLELQLSARSGPVDHDDGVAVVHGHHDALEGHEAALVRPSTDKAPSTRLSKYPEGRGLVMRSPNMSIVEHLDLSDERLHILTALASSDSSGSKALAELMTTGGGSRSSRRDPSSVRVRRWRHRDEVSLSSSGPGAGSASSTRQRSATHRDSRRTTARAIGPMPEPWSRPS